MFFARLKSFFSRKPLSYALRHDFCASKKPKLTIVFLHGIAASYASWRETVKLLEKDPTLKDVRFIGLDLPGFGRSPKAEKYDYEMTRRTLAKTLKRLKVKTPLVLAGHSMGCLIAADFAMANPERVARLVLVSPPVFRQREASNIADQFYNRAYTTLARHRGDALLQPFAKIVSALSSFESKALSTVAFREYMDNIILNGQNWRRAFALKTKAEMIHGRFDGLVIGENLAIIAERNRNIRLTRVTGAHDITGNKQRKVIKITTELLLGLSNEDS